MTNSQKKIIFHSIFGLLLSINALHAQTAKEIEIFNWFDSTIRKENLDINNGVLYTNPYRTIDDNNLYFLGDKFEKGNLTYNGQIYYDNALKYDVYRDILILNPAGTSELIGVSLNTEKVDSFTISNRNFVKIHKEQYNLPEFLTGYYETAKFSDNFIFYIKHSKSIQKKVKDDGAYYYFKDNNHFYLDYKKNLYPINSKNDLINLFPEQKKQINEFYLMNRSIRKSDLNQFMKNLMKYINTSLSNQAK
ncbi:hypothetical protein [Flavobacterium sp. KJJ]|uniref:hypothetical protein n=1 Tax=Flavobacterium sp. KJJ TaxID=1270193 RepID=UPI0004930800|nr:hypothetical protein [Flavobacterium sp. KJJ]